MYLKKESIINNINQLSKNDKIKIISILNMYQYESHIKYCDDGVRLDMNIVKDEHIQIIFDIINNIINIKKNKNGSS